MAEIITVQVGALATNCYLVGDQDSGACAVIDAGGDSAAIVTEADGAGWDVKYVLATHGHADHVGGVAPLVERYGAKFALGRGDAQMVAEPPEWLTSLLVDFTPPPVPDLLLDGGDTISVAGVEIAVLATPGHTQGSVCYQLGNVVFTGDTLFRGSIGRYDLPGGDGPMEIASIKSVLLGLGDDVEVRPGHGPFSSIREERNSNPFLR